MLAFLLGLFTWLGFGYWLEPGPIWQISFESGKPVVELLLEDELGRWLLASDTNDVFPFTTEHQDFAALTNRLRPSKFPVLILDSKTGQQVSQLVIHGLSLEPFPGKRAKLLGDTLWWFNTRQLDAEQILELHRWQFTQSGNEQIVKTWSMAPRSPIHCAFADGNSPLFMIQSTISWELGLIPQAFNTWSLLSTVIVQENAWKSSEPQIRLFGISTHDKEMKLQSNLMPFVTTYSLPVKATEGIPRRLASWTLPCMRWNIPAIGKEMQWLAWGDCLLPHCYQTGGLNSFAKPSGVLVFNGRDGKACRLQEDQGFRAYPQACFVFGNCIAVASMDYDGDRNSRVQYRLFATEGGKLLQWPAGMTDRSFEYKRIRESTDQKRTIFVMDYFPGCMRSLLHSYQLFEQTTPSPAMKAEATVPENCGLSDWQLPLAFADNQLAFNDDADKRPAWIRKLDQDWPQVSSWLSRLFQSERLSVSILQADTGNLLRTFASRRTPQHLRCATRLYMERTKYDRGTYQEQSLALEAWDFPLSEWSPWWGRGAGVAVMVILLIPGWGRRLK